MNDNQLWTAPCTQQLLIAAHRLVFAHFLFGRAFLATLQTSHSISFQSSTNTPNLFKIIQLHNQISQRFLRLHRVFHPLHWEEDHPIAHLPAISVCFLHVLDQLVCISLPVDHRRKLIERHLSEGHFDAAFDVLLDRLEQISHQMRKHRVREVLHAFLKLAVATRCEIALHVDRELDKRAEHFYIRKQLKLGSIRQLLLLRRGMRGDHLNRGDREGSAILQVVCAPDSDLPYRTIYIVEWHLESLRES